MEPWRTEAQRVEISERLAHPLNDSDRKLAELEDLQWRFTAAVGQGDPDLASNVRRELDELLRRKCVEDPGYGYNTRAMIVMTAIRAGDLNDAAVELMEWFSHLDLDGVVGMKRKAAYHESQSWGLRAVEFLDHPQSESRPARASILAALENLMGCCRGDCNAQLEEGYARVRVVP